MLVCARCGSGSIILDRENVAGVGWIERPKCMKCGREKFVEKENPAKIIRTELVERVKQEANMGKSGICKYEGCDKVRLAGGYCYRHYKEVNGHPYKGGQKNHKGGNITMTTEQKIIPAAEATQADPPIPLIQLFLYPELLEKLTARAKAEYRTPELEAAYLIDKALEG